MRLSLVYIKRMLKMRRQLAVGSRYSPAVVPVNYNVRCALIYHRLHRNSCALGKAQTVTGLTVIRYGWIFMQITTYAVTDKNHDHTVTEVFTIALNSIAYIAEPNARAHYLCRMFKRGFVTSISLFGIIRHIADPEGRRAVSVKAVDISTDVYTDYIAVFNNNLFRRYAVNYDIVYRDTRAAGNPP